MSRRLVASFQHDGPMNEAFDAHAALLDVSELPSDQCPDGPLATGVAVLAEAPGLTVGVWEHPVGRSTDVEQDEVFVVLSGRGRVLLADGRVLELAPGTVGVLEAGTPTTWEIEETLRKVWVVGG
jgi:uncharacterized protein